MTIMASRIAYNMSSGQINTESGFLSYRKMLFSWAFDYYLKPIVSIDGWPDTISPAIIIS